MFENVGQGRKVSEAEEKGNEPGGESSTVRASVMVGMLPARTLVPEFLCYLTNNGGFLLPPFTHVSLASSHLISH